MLPAARCHARMDARATAGAAIPSGSCLEVVTAGKNGFELKCGAIYGWEHEHNIGTTTRGIDHSGFSALDMGHCCGSRAESAVGRDT